MSVTGGGGRAKVAGDGATVADLRGADRARGHGQPGQPVTKLGDHPGIRHARAEPDHIAVGRPFGQLSNPREVVA